jgi:mycothiol synthase
MRLTLRSCTTENDFWRIRNFLREVFLLNDRLEHSWHVARLDHWRWHFILTCHETAPFDQVTVAWETDDGQIAAVLHPICHDEIRLHVHPHFRTPELEEEAFSYAEEHYSDSTENGSRILYMPVFSDDAPRQEVLTRRGFTRRPGWGHHYRRDLDSPLPEGPIPPGYEIRSMGGLDEHPARSWCSWRAFHAEELDEKYDGDHTWYQNMQSAPLYRRDLDIVAATPAGEIAAFCTISYDDTTRSAVTVLVGTAAEHWRRGLGKTVMVEGMRRLKHLGCTRVFSTAHNEKAADALYHSMMQERKVTDTWVKEFRRERK